MRTPLQGGSPTSVLVLAKAPGALYLASKSLKKGLEVTTSVHFRRLWV